jgi:hypothetical protein
VTAPTTTIGTTTAGALRVSVIGGTGPYCRPPRTEVIRCVLKPSQFIRPM